MSGATERVIVTLQATVTYEYQEVIEVPAGTSDAELARLAGKRYEDVDGGLYGQVDGSWSPCGQTATRVAHELIDTVPAPELRASFVDGEPTVNEIEYAA